MNNPAARISDTITCQ